MSWLDTGAIMGQIGEFLAEDLGRGDITTQATVPNDARGVGRFLAKEDLILCGLEVAEAVFLHLDGESTEMEAGFQRRRRSQSRNGFRDAERLCRCFAGGRANGAEFDSETFGHRHADPTVCAGGRRHAALRLSIRARRRPVCGFWKNTP